MFFDKLMIGMGCLVVAAMIALSGCGQTYPPSGYGYPPAMQARIMRDRQGRLWRVIATPYGPALQPVRQPKQFRPVVPPATITPAQPAVTPIRYEVKASTQEKGAAPKADHRTPVSDAELAYTCSQPDAIAHVACRSYAASHDAMQVLNRLRLERIESAKRAAVAGAVAQVTQQRHRYPGTMSGSANEFGVECSSPGRRRYLVVITNQRQASAAAALDRRVIVDEGGNPVVAGYGDRIYTCVAPRELGVHHKLEHAVHEAADDGSRWRPAPNTTVSNTVYLEAKDAAPNFLYLMSR